MKYSTDNNIKYDFSYDDKMLLCALLTQKGYKQRKLEVVDRGL